jgi:hypothetical protein
MSIQLFHAQTDREMEKKDVFVSWKNLQRVTLFVWLVSEMALANKSTHIEFKYPSLHTSQSSLFELK